MLIYNFLYNKMATLKILVLAAACVSAYAFPMEPTVPMNRNTIFADEMLEGEIFKDLEKFDLLDDRNIRDNSSSYRLPTTTRPHHYNVLWDINITNLTFSGIVEILFYATAANVPEMVIHSSELSILSLQLSLNNVAINTTYVEEEEPQFLRIQQADGSALLYSATSPIIYTLTISFEAPLRTDMYGIYQSWYRNNYNDSVSWMASTQFQATAARWAFPCYDEPAFKATFDIIIRRPTVFKSWSATRINETVPAAS